MTGATPQAFMLSDFAEGTLPPRGARKTILAVEIYLDESGIHRAPCCLVAGLIADTQVWRPFENRWRSHLNEFGVTAFHAHKFFGREDGKRFAPYEGWSANKAEAFLAPLIELLVTGSHEGIKPYVLGVEREAFFRLNIEERRFLTGALWMRRKWVLTGAPNEPYYVPLTKVISVSLTEAHERVDFIHDEQNKYAETVRRLIEKARSLIDPRIRPRVGAITFGTKEMFVPLQAVDLIAYAAFQRADRATRGSDEYLSKTMMSHRSVARLREIKGLEIRIYQYEGLLKELGRKLPGQIRAGLTPHQMSVEMRRLKGLEKERRRPRNTRRHN